MVTETPETPIPLVSSSIVDLQIVQGERGLFSRRTVEAAKSAGDLLGFQCFRVLLLRPLFDGVLSSFRLSFGAATCKDMHVLV